VEVNKEGIWGHFKIIRDIPFASAINETHRIMMMLYTAAVPPIIGKDLRNKVVCSSWYK